MNRFACEQLAEIARVVDDEPKTVGDNPRHEIQVCLATQPSPTHMVSFVASICRGRYERGVETLVD
jgi:hypothetical protein